MFTLKAVMPNITMLSGYELFSLCHNFDSREIQRQAVPSLVVEELHCSRQLLSYSNVSFLSKVLIFFARVLQNIT